MTYVIGIIERICILPKTVVYCSVKNKGLSLISSINKSYPINEIYVNKYSAKEQAINYVNMKGHQLCCDVESNKNFWWVKIK